MDTFASVWDAADGVEADQSLASLTAARIQVIPSWSFLAVAKSTEEFQHRFALVEDRIRESAQDHGVEFSVLAKSLVDDFRATAAFYVKDGDKEVGGPYDSKSDAQDAITGGDVTGDDLTVSGGGDNNDDGVDEDGDGKDEDDSDDTDDDDSKDDGDDDDKGGNPFAKKSAFDFPVIEPKVAMHSVVHQPGETVFVDHFMGHDEHEGRKGVWAQVVASPGQHPHADRADSHLLKPMAPGGTHFFHHFGSVKTEAMDWNTQHNEERDDEDDKPTLNRSNFDGSQREYDYFADHEPHSEDNYGDPYGRSERRHEASARCTECGHDAHGSEQCNGAAGIGKCTCRVNKKTALADGVDPLALIISTVPGGEGQAEAEAHHEGATASLISRFASVYNDFVTE